MNSIITVDGQTELDDIIFSCGTILSSKNLYAARHLNCASPVENAYHSSKIGKQTTLIKEATSERSDGVISAVNSAVDHTKSTVNSSIDFSLKTLKIETSSRKRQTSLDGCLVVVKKKEKREAETELVRNESNKRKSEEENCIICKQEDPPGSSKLIKWVDCDEFHDWAHLSCAKKEEDGWRNICRNSWFCKKH